MPLSLFQIQPKNMSKRYSIAYKIPSIALQITRVYLRSTLGGDVTESQFAVVTVPEGPDRRAVGGHAHRVVQSARNLPHLHPHQRRHSLWQLLVARTAVT